VRPSDQFKNRLGNSFHPTAAAVQQQPAAAAAGERRRPSNASGTSLGPHVPSKQQQYATYESVEVMPMPMPMQYKATATAATPYYTQQQQQQTAAAGVYAPPPQYPQQQGFYAQSQVPFTTPQYFYQQPTNPNSYQKQPLPSLPDGVESMSGEGGESQRSGSNAGLETNPQGVPKLF
jgi:hypothetical protein